MDMQNVSNLVISEGEVRTIHDKDSRLLWGRVSYDVKYSGDAAQDGTPTPDSPVIVQTVTGEQTVTVSGKNLAPSLSEYAFSRNGSTTTYSVSGNSLTVKTSRRGYGVYMSRNNATNIARCPYLFQNGYVVSMTVSATTSGILRMGPDTAGSRMDVNVGLEPVRVSFPAVPNVNIIFYQQSEGTLEYTISDIQCESGASATDYEVYQSQPYAINLGALELCKIGDYQDYIYKSGDDWYIHKEIGKALLNGSEEWTLHSQVHNNINGFRLDVGTVASDGYGVKSDNFYAVPWLTYQRDGVSGRNYGMITTLNSSGPYIYISQPNSSVRTLSDFTTWLGSHNTKLYYALATPTDTQITDATLISQLDAIHQFLTRYGYNSTVSGNLPLIISKTNL